MRRHLNDMLVILILFCSFLSCKEENSPEINNVFQVTVVGEGEDCGLLLIDFDESDKLRIERITETTDWLRFFALNLDKKYNQVGKILKIKVRKTKNEELFACTSLGPAYPWVTVLSVDE